MSIPKCIYTLTILTTLCLAQEKAKKLPASTPTQGYVALDASRPVTPTKPPAPTPQQPTKNLSESERELLKSFAGDILFGL